MVRLGLNIAVGLIVASVCVFAVSSRLDFSVRDFLEGFIKSESSLSEVDLKSARFGSVADIKLVYNSLSKLDSIELYRMRANERLCQDYTFDCRSLTRSSTMTLIDGVFKMKEGSASRNSFGVSLAGLFVAVLSLVLSVPSALRRR